MIVTIDGPAGAGKSTVAKSLAEKLGFRFLDTGAMYRAVTLAALRRGLPCQDATDWAELAKQLEIRFQDQCVLLDGEDVTDAIRSSQVTGHIRYAADNPQVREHLVKLQQEIGRTGDIVTEGRDQGTVVFPHAECKIFLTASPEERARRRVRDLQQRGERPSFDEVLAQQVQRDQRDSNRAVGPLVRAQDAIEVVTDGMAIDEVVERLVEIAGTRRHARLGEPCYEKSQVTVPPRD